MKTPLSRASDSDEEVESNEDDGIFIADTTSSEADAEKEDDETTLLLPSHESRGMDSYGATQHGTKPAEEFLESIPGTVYASPVQPKLPSPSTSSASQGRTHGRLSGTYCS